MSSQLNADGIQLMKDCPKCGRKMGPLRPYLAVTSSPDKRKNRGRLCQTCTGQTALTKCVFTTFHTVDSYDIAEAEVFCSQFYANAQNTSDGPSIPLPAPSPVRAPAPSQLPLSAPPDSQNPFSMTQKTRLGCKNADTGCKRSGNRACTEGMCKGCCGASARDAKANSVGRSGCKEHGVHAVPSPNHTQPAKAPPLPNSQSSPRRSPVDATRTADDPFADNSPSQQGPPAAAANQASQRAPSGRRGARLAQPIGPLWTNAYEAATSRRETTQTSKSKQEELNRREKHTVKLVIYHAPSRSPLRLTQMVHTYPRIQLTSLDSVMDGLGLTAKSWVDYYDKGAWTTIQPDAVLNLQHKSQLLFRLRPSLVEELSESDCPGIEDDLAREPGYLKRKREGADAGGPPTKITRVDEVIEIDDDAASTQPIVSKPERTVKPEPFPMSLPLAQENRIVHAPKEKFSTREKEIDRRTKLFKSSKGHITVFKAAVEHFTATGERKSPSFPLDFYMCDVQDGLRHLGELMAKNGQQKTLFPVIFDGAKLVKASLWKHRKLLENAPEELKIRFYNYGRTSEGYYKLFRDIADPPKRSGPKNRMPTSVSDDLSDSDSNSSIDLEMTPEPSDSGSKRKGKQVETEFSQSVSRLRSVNPNGSDLDDSEEDLCPFCDTEMPPTPSAELQKMLQDLLAISILDPLPYNKHHRSVLDRDGKPSFTPHATYCERHRYEAIEAPRARERGWPTVIDFEDLERRAKELTPELVAVTQALEDSIFFQLSKPTFAPGSSKKSHREYVTFTEGGTGYYGELGFQIMTTTLRRLFPIASFDPSTFAPLSYTALIEEVLTPELSVRLIMDDLSITRGKAIDTLRQSRQFGNFTHPGDEDNMVLQKLTMYREPSPIIKIENIETALEPVGKYVIDLTGDSDD
ncbi:hypothetical protein DFP72DRAFT_1060601 [Ephemerocybe angulata]|uniref:Restriction of telomere capping protein 4 n=1 Tax=Ephemerocybe angulata TaxID=980116 RepID=A0A8H6IFM8_9AGAR|nr:hypothetical protein DFP72DRAFT_1060601 [Tulosesus angulatus]